MNKIQFLQEHPLEAIKDSWLNTVAMLEAYEKEMDPDLIILSGESGEISLIALGLNPENYERNFGMQNESRVYKKLLNGREIFLFWIRGVDNLRFYKNNANSSSGGSMVDVLPIIKQMNEILEINLQVGKETGLKVLAVDDVVFGGRKAKEFHSIFNYLGFRRENRRFVALTQKGTLLYDSYVDKILFEDKKFSDTISNLADSISSLSKDNSNEEKRTMTRSMINTLKSYSGK